MCSPRHPCRNHYQGRCWSDATAECERCGDDVAPSTDLVPPPVALCAECVCCDYCGRLVASADLRDVEGDRGCAECALKAVA